MAGVRFDNVSKRYDDEITAVDALDLTVEDGEFMVLLGPSGCGKSTALRMVAGLEEISDGRVLIGDRVVNRVDPARRDVAMVFQSYALYPHMTVERNIVSPLRTRRHQVDPDGPPRKLTRPERQARVVEAAEMLDLTPLLQRKPAALSGGQRQRVALARALVGRPRAFLMDEPLSNLDAKLRAQTRAELVDLHNRVGTTTIYVTHDQVEAMTMASRVAVLADGRLQQVGTPQEVYEQPANLFVARFLGTPPMNTLSGRIVLRNGEPRVEVDESLFPVPAPVSPSAPEGRLEEGRPVMVGVRPEHLEPDADGAIRLAVRTVEWMGHECHITGSIGDDRMVVRRNGMVQGAGPELRLTAAPDGIHLFDPDTSERLA